MLGSLLQTLDAIFGPALAPYSSYTYWAGLVLLSLVLAGIPMRLFWRRRLERRGIVETWSVRCKRCQSNNNMAQPTCVNCQGKLSVPLSLRLRAKIASLTQRSPVRWLRTAYPMAGFFAFLLLSLQIGSTAGAFAEVSNSHTLLVGLVFIFLALLGRSLSRALGFSGQGLGSRLTEMLIALAAIGAVTIFTHLADASHTKVDSVLSFHVTKANTPSPKLGPPYITTADSDGRVGVEYLQIQHATMKERWFIPKALIGASRTELRTSRIDGWLSEHFKNNASQYSQRGLRVRMRTEWAQVEADTSYEVVEEEGEILIGRKRRK